MRQWRLETWGSPTARSPASPPMSKAESPSGARRQAAGPSTTTTSSAARAEVAGGGAEETEENGRTDASVAARAAAAASVELGEAASVAFTGAGGLAVVSPRASAASASVIA